MGTVKVVTPYSQPPCRMEGHTTVWSGELKDIQLTPENESRSAGDVTIAMDSQAAIRAVGGKTVAEATGAIKRSSGRQVEGVQLADQTVKQGAMGEPDEGAHQEGPGIRIA